MRVASQITEKMSLRKSLFYARNISQQMVSFSLRETSH